MITQNIIELETEFKACLMSIGHPLSSEMQFDTPKWQSYACPGSKRNKSSAGYRAHSDGVVNIEFQCKRCGIQQNFFIGTTRKLSSDQYQQIKDRKAEQLRIDTVSRLKAIEGLKQELATSLLCTSHPYLEKKQCKIANDDGFYIGTRGELLCPVKNIKNELISLQAIYWYETNKEFKKIFRRDTSPKNGFLILGVIDNSNEMYFAEGIATCLSIKEAINKPVICVYGKNFDSIAPIIANAYPHKRCIYCCDLSSKNEHVTSQDNANKAISLIGGIYVLPDFSMIPNDFMPEISRSDYNDLFVLLIAKGLNRTAALDIVRQQIAQNSTQGNCMIDDNKTQKEDLISEIGRVALLDKVEYELTREKIANKFRIRVSELDKFVIEERETREETKSETIFFSKIEPWNDEVILSVLLDDIVILLNKYVSFNSDHESRAIALWVIHTYCLDAAYFTPILFITSAEMRSGKSTLLAILQKIVFKCVAASNITPAVIFRLVSKYHPTILCDEADTYMTNQNEGLRCILDAGHSRDTASIYRINPDSLEPDQFDCFGAKCLAAIGRLPGTLEDRSIIIKMRRMVKGQKKEKMRLINESLRVEFHILKRKCLRFSIDNTKKLESIKLSMPDELNDRAADNWYSLFQISLIADEKWQQYTLDAAAYLSCMGTDQETKSRGIELLEHVKKIWTGPYKGCVDITTEDLIQALCKDEESPWPTYSKTGKRISPRELANLLKPYGINSKNLNKGKERPKGYYKSHFQDAFDRYLYSPASDLCATTATTAQPNNHKTFTENEANTLSATIRSLPLPSATSPLSKVAVADSSGSERIKLNPESALKSAPDIAVAAVAAKNTILGAGAIESDFMDF